MIRKLLNWIRCLFVTPFANYHEMALHLALTMAGIEHFVIIPSANWGKVVGSTNLRPWEFRSAQKAYDLHNEVICIEEYLKATKTPLNARVKDILTLLELLR